MFTIANLEKKEQKRISVHEKNIENAKKQIWKYEQKLNKDDLKADKKLNLQHKINKELDYIQMQENILENPNLKVQTE